MNDELIIGMLSGTSLDGVDAVLVSFGDVSMDMLHAVYTPYPPAIKLTLEQLLETGKAPTDTVLRLLDENIGRFLARVAQNLTREAGMETRDIRAIGSHGQNVWHQACDESPKTIHPGTIQLGKGEIIARNTGTTVVTNFRQADVAAGRRGAPLTPLFHQHLFHSETENRAVLNLGGIASLTILPAGGGLSGFDCGPGLCLLDTWCKRHLGTDHDNNGNWARKGEADPALLDHLLDDPCFSLAAPGSTGLEYFNGKWLDSKLADSSVKPVDVQATLAELTAVSIARSLLDFTAPGRLLVCGGGAHNAYLMRRIAAALPDVVVEHTTRHGADPDWVEGLLFAWLARERLNGRMQDTGPVTGARHPVLLGDIFGP